MASPGGLLGGSILAPGPPWWTMGAAGWTQGGPEQNFHRFGDDLEYNTDEEEQQCKHLLQLIPFRKSSVSIIDIHDDEK